MKRHIYGLEGLIKELEDLKQYCFDMAFACECLTDNQEKTFTRGFEKGSAEAFRIIMKRLGSYDIYDPNAQGETKHIRIGKEQL